MAIQKCAAKLGSAPGLDKIDNYLMSNLSQNFKLELLNAFNSMMREGSFPESWREIFILFIPTGTPHKFRPISLAQVPLKVLERMIQLRLVWWLEHNHRLPQCQFGFRKGKSCQDSLSVLTASIYESFSNSGFTAAAFLDVKGAFSNIVPNLLIHRLKNIRVPVEVCRFIYFIISTS